VSKSQGSCASDISERTGNQDNGSISLKVAHKTLHEHSENVRRRLAEIFSEIRKAVAKCLKAAVKEGELPPKFQCNEVAEFVVSSMQGAMLLGRSQRNLASLRHFKDILFSKVLR
jgi:TetR/AcrR family transcriptional repressor of nem operon